MREIEVGIDGSGGVRCGVIGEIGCSYPLMDVEKKALQAAATAQTKTGDLIGTILQFWSKNFFPSEIVISCSILVLNLTNSIPVFLLFNYFLSPFIL